MSRIDVKMALSQMEMIDKHEITPPVHPYEYNGISSMRLALISIEAGEKV